MTADAPVGATPVREDGPGSQAPPAEEKEVAAVAAAAAPAEPAGDASAAEKQAEYNARISAGRGGCAGALGWIGALASQRCPALVSMLYVSSTIADTHLFVGAPLLDLPVPVSLLTAPLPAQTTVWVCVPRFVSHCLPLLSPSPWRCSCRRSEGGGQAAAGGQGAARGIGDAQAGAGVLQRESTPGSILCWGLAVAHACTSAAAVLPSPAVVRAGVVAPVRHLVLIWPPLERCCAHSPRSAVGRDWRRLRGQDQVAVAGGCCKQANDCTPPRPPAWVLEACEGLRVWGFTPPYPEHHPARTLS